MRILLRRPEGWRQVDPREYSNEEELQALLKDSPEIIPRNPPDLEAIAYCREFPIGSYSIDLVGVGSDGSISLIECKLANNRERKRTVVGQVLEYAAGVWRMNVAEFEEAFESSTGHSFFDELRGAAAEEWDETACRERLANNLARGRFRLLIAVDAISAELRGIIEYVNSQPGDLRLVALELPYFTDGTTQVLVPETYGDEVASAVSHPSGRSPSVAEHLAEHPELQALHVALAAAFPRQKTTPYQIAYRGSVNGREESIVQMYFPERRLYLPDGITRMGGDIGALQAEARELGLAVPSSTSIEWPAETGERMDALLGLVQRRICSLFTR